jgi:hypothetical protein
VEFDHDVVAGSVAECNGPGCGLAGFGRGAGAGGQVFVGVLGSGGDGGHTEAGHGENRRDSPNELRFDIQQSAPLTVVALIFL